TPEAMQQLGAEMAADLHGGDVVFFEGELGAGKTTLIRGILQAWGYLGFVKSPSYSLIELYQFESWRVVHVDLYRLNRAEEVTLLGLSDYLDDKTIFFIEWPDKAKNFLPPPSWECKIKIVNDARRVEVSRG